MSILIWIISGIVAGWLAGVIVKGAGFGLIGDLLVGLVGGLIGGWLAGVLGLQASSWFGQILVVRWRQRTGVLHSAEWDAMLDALGMDVERCDLGDSILAAVVNDCVYLDERLHVAGDLTRSERQSCTDEPTHGHPAGIGTALAEFVS